MRKRFLNAFEIQKKRLMCRRSEKLIVSMDKSFEKKVNVFIKLFKFND